MTPACPVVEFSDGRWLATFDCFPQYDDPGPYQPRMIGLFSAARGQTWGEPVTIADGTPERKGCRHGQTIRLADGRLYIMFGMFGAADLTDPAASVAPCVRCLSNGMLALSTGRPGIWLWLSLDRRGQAWHAADLLAHHNAVMGAKHHIGVAPDTAHEQTTAYTTLLVEVAPDQLLLVYDRVPFGWQPVPVDSAERNRVYVLPISVERQ